MAHTKFGREELDLVSNSIIRFIGSERPNSAFHELLFPHNIMNIIGTTSIFPKKYIIKIDTTNVAWGSIFYNLPKVV